MAVEVERIDASGNGVGVISTGRYDAKVGTDAFILEGLRALQEYSATTGDAEQRRLARDLIEKKKRILRERGVSLSDTSGGSSGGSSGGTSSGGGSVGTAGGSTDDDESPYTSENPYISDDGGGDGEAAGIPWVWVGAAGAAALGVLLLVWS